MLAISLPGLDVTELFAGFNTTFPGGVGVDGDSALVYYSTWPATLVAGATDGSGFEVVAGLTVVGDVVYLADAGGEGGDLFALSY